MKKTILYIIAVLLLSVTVVTMFAVFDRNETVYEPTEEGAATVSFTHGKTVLPDFIYNSAAIEASGLYTVHTLEETVFDPDDADCVALCTVIDVYYTFVGGSAWTQADVRVDEVTHGKLTEGEMISVYIPGGYVSTDDYEAYYGEGKYSESGADYIEFIINDEPHPRAGDNGIFCVNRAANSSPLPDGAYIRLHTEP